MGQLRHVLVHTARRLRVVDGDAEEEWIEGEPGESGPTTVAGDPFPVVLFLPLGTEDTGRPRSKQVSRPTLLWEPVNADTGATIDSITADDELLLVAPELALDEEGVVIMGATTYGSGAYGAPGGTYGQLAATTAEGSRWMVDGAPQPFGPPGRVIGVQAIVKQVRG